MNAPSPINMRMVRMLIWAYFALLIFEGALRKWVLPQLADAFLIIRDPVVIAIYLLALRDAIFPKRVMVSLLYLLAICSFFISLTFGQAPLAVVIFGMHTNFLHVPLIFIMAKVLHEDDLRWIGRVCFFLAPAMAFLMALQFNAPGDAWVNRGASAGGEQIGTALGHIRPAGFFSYNTGATQFWCFNAAFLLDGWTRRQYPLWLLVLAAASQMLAVGVSGSRTAVASLFLVVAAYIIIAPRTGKTVRAGWIVGVLFLVGLAVGSTGLFQEGIETLTARFDEANDVEGSMLTRAAGDFHIPFATSSIFGRGLGLGTNVGAKLTIGEAAFLIAEGEWGRIMGESGWMFGFLFILWRIALAGELLVKSWKFTPSRGPLAWLLWSTTGLGILNGQWGQATSLGFSVFGAGLILAAARPLTKEDTLEDDDDSSSEEPAEEQTGWRLRGRSVYSQTLHDQ